MKLRNTLIHIFLLVAIVFLSFENLAIYLTSPVLRLNMEQTNPAIDFNFLFKHSIFFFYKCLFVYLYFLFHSI